MTTFLWLEADGARRADATPLCMEWPENALSFVGDATRVLVLPFAALVLAIPRWEMRLASADGRRAATGGGWVGVVSLDISQRA